MVMFVMARLGVVRLGMGCTRRHAHSMSGHGEADSFVWLGKLRCGGVRSAQVWQGL